jgi:hypothetical protein
MWHVATSDNGKQGAKLLEDHTLAKSVCCMFQRQILDYLVTTGVATKLGWVTNTLIWVAKLICREILPTNSSPAQFRRD